MNLLRSAAATNQVRLRVRHYFPPLSSSEYQKFLYEEKSTDDDDDYHQRQQKINHQNLTTNDLRTRKSSRKHHHHHRISPDEDQQRSFDHHRDDQRDPTKISHVSSHALQSILNSKFKWIDLVDLLKSTYPKYFPHDQNKESIFIEQLSQTNPGSIPFSFSLLRFITVQ